MHISCRKEQNFYYSAHSPVHVATLFGALQEAWRSYLLQMYCRKIWRACDRASWLISYNKPNRCTNFSKFYFGMKLCMFRTVPLSIIRGFHCTHSNGICHTGLLTVFEQDQDGNALNPDSARKPSANLYDIYHCCVYSENSWWCTEELSETCRVSFQNKILKNWCI